MIKHSLISPCAALIVLSVMSVMPVQAKLPAPSDEAKAKAAEAAAKTAHGNKVANFQLCRSMDTVAAGYVAQAKKNGKAIKPADASAAACADPGAFVYVPPVPAPVPAAVPAGVVATAPAAVPAAAPKK